MANVQTSQGNNGKDATKAAPNKAPAAWNPFVSLRGEIDRLFDDFMPSGFFDWPRASNFPAVKFDANPKVDVSETKKEYAISAELPGIDEKDVDVTLADGVLTIKGEKSEQKEHEEKDKQVHWSERSYGSFRRSFRVPESVDTAKVAAEFKNGVLKVTLPKSSEAQKSARKIEIKK